MMNLCEKMSAVPRAVLVNPKTLVMGMADNPCPKTVLPASAHREVENLSQVAQ